MTKFFGNIMNRISEGPGQTAPTVGMGCTITMYSDRRAATVIEIKSPYRIVIQCDNAKRIDNNGMSDSQDYAYTPNPLGKKAVFTKRRDGRWKELKGSDGLRLGSRDEYYDFSF